MERARGAAAGQFRVADVGGVGATRAGLHEAEGGLLRAGWIRVASHRSLHDRLPDGIRLNRVDVHAPRLTAGGDLVELRRGLVLGAGVAVEPDTQRLDGVPVVGRPVDRVAHAGKPRWHGEHVEREHPVARDDVGKVDAVVGGGEILGEHPLAVGARLIADAERPEARHEDQLDGARDRAVGPHHPGRRAVPGRRNGRRLVLLEGALLLLLNPGVAPLARCRCFVALLERIGRRRVVAVAIADFRSARVVVAIVAIVAIVVGPRRVGPQIGYEHRQGIDDEVRIRGGVVGSGRIGEPFEGDARLAGIERLRIGGRERCPAAANRGDDGTRTGLRGSLKTLRRRSVRLHKHPLIRLQGRLPLRKGKRSATAQAPDRIPRHAATEVDCVGGRPAEIRIDRLR